MLIDTDITISNTCDENIIVTNNATLIVKGICSNKITLQPNCNLFLIGKCNELEINYSSSATIEGTAKHVVNKGNLTINGTVNHLEDLSKSATINEGSIVDNKQY